MTETRLAVWSGPRNVSTSLMRSFANRGDCKVLDEPFYGAYLRRSNKTHPLREEIIDSMCTSYEEVSKICSTYCFNKKVLYQKQMAHHIFPDLDLSFLDALNNVFLIREPKYVVKSFNEKVENFGLGDIGIKQQVELFEYLLARNGVPPLVISSSDLLNHPTALLKDICKHAGIDFREEMLSWPKGPHPDDGIWGSVWYENVYESSCFIKHKPNEPDLTNYQMSVAEEAYPYYERLKSFIKFSA